MKTDVRPQIKLCNRNIGSVICKSDGSLQVCYYKNKDEVMLDVSKYLIIKSLLQCFTKIDFIKVDSQKIIKIGGLKNDTNNTTN